ncbi:16S rRNA (cytosine(1402)-N(4))-methyltransferase RsmH [Bdellovibrionota bacterium FG-1]
MPTVLPTTAEAQSVHIPILVEPILAGLLAPFRALGDEIPSHILVDCTFGGGGHTAAFLEALACDPRLSRHSVMAFDQDASAIERGRVRFSEQIAAGKLELVHSPFSQANHFLAGRPVLGLMADLGFSSDQLEDAERGLSFSREGPLDMRLDPSRGQSARQYLFQMTERQLADLIHELGEERFSRQIAAAIVEARRRHALPTTTIGLGDLIVKAVPPAARHGRIHAATRTFQALRILVNEELEELDTLLKRVILEVKSGGRVAILSFHSLEDRKVKQAFRDKEGLFRPLTKKPQEADEAEMRRNPRSRSAKLRIAERMSENVTEVDANMGVSSHGRAGGSNRLA